MNGVGFAAVIISVVAIAGLATWYANCRSTTRRGSNDLHAMGEAVSAARTESDRIVADRSASSGVTTTGHGRSSSATSGRATVRRVAPPDDGTS